jgi:D-glycero-alpha-D-manno-heptose-7-phosphate kinase
LIIVRSPLRITLGGGGTDLPSYYMEHGGHTIAAAIEKYVYVTVNESFRNRITLKYSSIEDVATPEEVKHPIIREALKLLDIPGSVDIDTIADIPYGTGMGSSGSFTTALLYALHLFKRETLTKRELAEEAFHVEHDILKGHCGRQDQYIAAVGGVTEMCFTSSGVDYRALNVSRETLANLEDGLVHFFTGYARSANSILADQDQKSNQKKMIDHLGLMKRISHKIGDSLTEGRLEDFGRLLDRHWRHKSGRTPAITNPDIDSLYELALRNGAMGGKLVGAGGGGFLMFYSENKPLLRKAMNGFREIKVRFDFEGTSIMVHA